MKNEYTSVEVFHMYRATGLLSLLDEIIEHIGEQEYLINLDYGEPASAKELAKSGDMPEIYYRLVSFRKMISS